MPAVRDTPEFRRVRDLPRRRLNEDDAAAWAKALTPQLKRPGSRAALLPWQGMALAEALEHRGAYIVLPVGHGKTLITYLLPTVFETSRSVTIVPGAGLREKTYAEFGELGRDWQGPRTPSRVLTWQELSTERGEMLLEELKPTLIVIDESDELANFEAAAPARIDRYIEAHPTVVVMCLTGTPIRKSIMNFWHLLYWCLRKGSPMPLVKSEAVMWAASIDHQKGARGLFGISPGPLGVSQDDARAWFKARLAETPGVIIVDGDSCTAPLEVHVRLAREDAVLDDVFAYFLKTAETPDGQPVTDPLSRWRIDGQLGCGLWLRWNPSPPDEWRDALRVFGRFARDKIAHSRSRGSRPLDTEGAVIRAHRDHPIVAAWLAVKDSFEPRTEAVWLTDSVVKSAEDWLRGAATPGIVWCGMPEFGAALSASTGLPYYGEGGRDGGGRYLHAADPRRSFVASWHANKKGFNLQPWRRQLIVYPPQSAKWQEQIFGRSHRYGQDKSVRVEIMATSGGTFNAIDASIAESGFGRQTVGPSHKMLRATVTRDAPRLTVRNRYRWGGADVEAEPPTLEETERLARRVRASVRVPPARRSPPLAMATLKKIAFDGCIPRSRMLRIT